MSEPEMIDGAVGKIAIHDLGGSGDNTLLICHATGFLGRVYRAFADQLANDARLFALDMRAHGDSQAPLEEADFDWRGMADDVARVVDHLGGDVLHGFGHSMGGAALLEVERAKPKTFRSAMVFEPVVPPGMFAEDDHPIQRVAAARQRTFPSRGSALLRYSARPPLGLFRADVLHDYVQHAFVEDEDGQVTLKCTPENEATTFSMAGTIPMSSLAEIELEVTVARSGDGGLPAQLALAVQDTLPNAIALEFPTLTHFGPLQDPVIVANEMRKIMRAAS